ncbi:hypothetical protein SAMN05720766_101263 [Fibrobacter sp. UWH9]|uniref:hypothetical protein n=1 Tax=unclassified Fibrobacter TaxID=2634177 RepID=UPI00090F15F9|nr:MULTISPECIES: hypothetical protein [Fibrobacter]MCQ2098785.1 hypothetical protein [Fibrobacter sp.]MCL4100523.1 hypothetical protein [Fibrobacter succinogenes]MDO4947877.1 hypothetical protein [Fibrobacter sp.]OWV05717.1 hypothetical protein B7993_07390 [Fibrobacter sp. UWH3]OWV12825.1 hypothetical protein B7992_09075 [Fibrobacter sp. UWH1]
MSEEQNNQEVENQEAEIQAATAPVEPVAEPVAEPTYDPSMTQPQVIVQRERGFSHYVGFALLCVLCILFYFAPGIALTYVINMIPGVSLGAMAAWVFSAVLSVVVWLIFKLKIKGFKKSFYVYIGVCVLVVAILIAAEILTEQTGVFANIAAMLTGANA